MRKSRRIWRIQEITCPECEGTGEVHDPDGIYEECGTPFFGICPHCNGRGYLKEEECQAGFRIIYDSEF